jgi:hypothetical protein
MKVQKASLLYSSLIYGVKLTTKLAFHKVYYYFGNKEPILHLEHPSAIFANHVIETDIIALSHVYPYVKPKAKFCYAMRQDIVEPNFLIKEFRPKGFLKFVLHIIDKSKIIKILLEYIGGIGVKRPFRDDARNLVKSGELRNLVETQWEKMADISLKGRNLFLFPEGKFSETGWLDPIRRGLFLLKKKIPHLKINFITFTYDFITYNKMDLHIVFGELTSLENLQDEKEISDLVKEKLGNNYAITPANLFSYFILHSHFNSFSKESILNKLSSLIKNLENHPKPFHISEDLKKNLEIRWNEFIQKTIQNGFINDSENNYKQTEKLLYTDFKTGSEMRKKNSYLYHSNQLKSYTQILDELLKSF